MKFGIRLTCNAGVFWRRANAIATSHGPSCFFVLICLQVPRTVLDVSSLSDDDLIQKIRQWGGTPKALTENQEMMKIAARVLRADLTILQNYR